MKMAKASKPIDLLSKLWTEKVSDSLQSIPCCEKSRSALIDVLILIAVLIALALLFLSFSEILVVNSIEFIRPILVIVIEDIYEAPMIYAFLGLGMMCTVIAAMSIAVCASRRCGKAGCRGLYKAAEFDIQIETENSVKKVISVGKNGMRKSIFQLTKDHPKELEAELKKMAPVNGRAVLIFRARCGCSIGRMEVPGSKKAKKTKK